MSKYIERDFFSKEHVQAKVRLTTVDCDKHMNVITQAEGSFYCVTLDVASTKQLRDFLNEVYPLEKLPKPTYIVSGPTNLGNYTVERIAVTRKSIAAFGDSDDAALFAKVMNNGQDNSSNR